MTFGQAGDSGAHGTAKLARPLYFLVVASGAAALVYQVAWANILSFTFGSSTLAASAVVGGFMGGMGLGAWAFHRVDDRVNRPLATYAAIEAGIAASAGLLTLGFAWLPELFAAAAASLPTGLVLDLFRILLVVVLLLVPAAFMGATYPALCVVLIHSRSGVDAHLGRLYGLNTLGAALGALVAGLLLIEWLGLRSTVGVAVAVNLSVALAAALLSRGENPGAATQARSEDSGIPSALPVWLTGAVLVGSGFTSLGYEILWFRALRYLFGTGVYALTVMLVVFLLGLGTGALWLRRAARRPFPELDLARVQLAISLLALFSIGGLAVVLSSEGPAEWITSYPGQSFELDWWQRLLIDFATSLVLMLPATFFMGLSFPLATRLFLGDVSRVGERVGASYLLANLGSIVGAVLAATWLVPALGTVGGMRALAIVNAVLGAGLALWLSARDPRASRVVALVVLAVVVCSGLYLPPRLALRGDGASRIFVPSLVFEQENDVGTVQVWTSEEHPDWRSMTIDGATIGADGPWALPLYQKQVVLAHLAMRLDPSIRRTLNVGLATGSTLRALAAYEALETLDVVEINPAVVRASRLHAGAAVQDDPRTRVAVEDVSQYLLRTQETWDLIISDGKQRPGHSGNAKLLCRDFYKAALRRLSERGMLVQWIPLHTLPINYQSILRTFADTFPEMEVFVVTPGNSFLVGSRQPILGRVAAGPDLARVRTDLRSVRIAGTPALLARWVADREAILAVLPPGRVNTWDHSPLEFNVHRQPRRAAEAPKESNLTLLIRAHEIAVRGRRAPIPGADPVQAEVARVLLEAYAASHGSPMEALEMVMEMRGRAPKDPALAAAIGDFTRGR